MSKILPIRDLKNTTNISNICKESDGPVYITKNGYEDMVIMSTQVYDRLVAMNEIYSKLLEGERDLAEGKTRNADDVMKDIKDKYDLYG